MFTYLHTHTKICFGVDVLHVIAEQRHLIFPNTQVPGARALGEWAREMGLEVSFLAAEHHPINELRLFEVPARSYPPRHKSYTMICNFNTIVEQFFSGFSVKAISERSGIM